MTTLASPPAPPDSGYGKGIAAGAAGIIVTGIVAVANQYLAHPLPAEAVAALQTLATVAAVYLTPHKLWSSS